MARINQPSLPTRIAPAAWIKGSAPKNTPSKQAASRVPVSRFLNDHPAKAPQIGASKLAASGGKSTAKPTAVYSREFFQTSQNDLKEIRESTLQHYGFLQAAEYNSTVTDVSNYSDLEKVVSANLAATLSKFLGNDRTLDSKIIGEKGAFQDKETGLYFEIHKKKTRKGEAQTYVLAFPGTGIPGMTGVQWKNNIQQITGGGDIPPAYRQAADLVARIMQNLPEKTTLELTGHSLGGGIANYVGLKHDLTSVCFNAAAIGKACLKDLGDIPRDRLEKQIHLRIKSDWMSSARTLAKLQKLYPSLIPFVPRQVGKVYTLPNQHANSVDFRDQHVSGAFRDFYQRRNPSEQTHVDPDALA